MYSLSNHKNTVRSVILILFLMSCIPVFCLWTLSLGALHIDSSQIIAALTNFDGSREHIIIKEIRLPRILAAIYVGACLSMAGVIMQAVLNNPLASPGLFGINAGATFFVVIAIFFIGSVTRGVYVWSAFLGATLTAALIYFVSQAGRDGATPMKLILLGAMISFFMSSLTAVILILDKGTLSAVQQWTIGSLKGSRLEHVIAVAPYGIIGLTLSILFQSQIHTLSFGETLARSVGQNITLWRFLASLCVVLLAGSSVALAGPIGFLGLVIPHLARFLVGPDLRLVMPCAAILGALIVILADNPVRFMIVGRDLPVGITMAVLGAPFFIYLARFRVKD